MAAWSSSRTYAAAVLALAGLATCATFSRQDAAGLPSDENIAAMFLAANSTDISYAQVALAPGRTANTTVLDFAKRMLDDHGGLNKAAMELFSSEKITPKDNNVSLDFRDESAFKRDTLRERTGTLFDSTYMANEVRYHSRLLRVLDSLLIPAARHADLKTMLSTVRPAVAAHLEHAERVQSGLPR